MLEFANTLNGWVWSSFLVYLCLGTGLFFSLRSRFVQLRMFREMLRLMFQKKTDNSGVSSFQALSMTLAGRVGTGNIAGVATAICFGGPGALFWMWVVAFLGASSAFVESTLGQIYKEKINGEWTGGPAFYIEKAGHNKFFAWVFAIITLCAAGFLCPGVQSNSIALAAEHAFGLNPTITAALIASLLCFIVFGGLKRIANFTTLVVPFMAQAYIVVALIVVFYNVDHIPEIFRLIFSSAFSLDSTFGGIAGAAVSWGVKRGIYSNEAGQGTGPHASSAASVSHPAKQGLVQAFSVYIDTWFVCTATGFMILLTGCYNVTGSSGFLYEGLKGATAGPVYTQMAVDSVMPGFGSPFITIALFFFAFTTILAYCYQAEVNVKFINRYMNLPWLLPVMRIICAASVAYGAIKTADVAWMLGDIGIGLMAWVNLIAILLLQGPAFKALRDYENQLKPGVEPVFHPEQLGIKNAEYWEGNRAELNLELEETEGINNQPVTEGLRKLIRGFYGKD
ncbi:MAG: alanine:cation symporter family protein [Duodenibacillus sp.]|nr:alanine:cation symporter family protein [Duodenibacillus sp.]